MDFKKPSPKGMYSITNSVANVNLWTGAVRSTKTINSVIRLIEVSKNSRVPKDVKGVLVGKTKGTLERNIFSILTELVGKNNFIYKRTLGQAYLFGRVFDVVGAKDESSKDKIQGATYGIGYCDELALYPRSFWDMLLSRFISIKNYIILATCNPESPFHYVKTDIIEQAKKLAYKIFDFNLDDNPYLPAENVKKLKAKYKGVFYQRFILGLWVLAEGLVYSMFNEAKNMFSVFEPSIDQIFDVGIDYGIKNPFAMGLFTINKYTKDHLMLKEFYWNGREHEEVTKTNEDYADHLLDFVGNRRLGKIFCDPSAVAFINTVKKRYPKLGAKFATTDNTVRLGIESVASALSLGIFKIHKSCKNTKKEFNVYSWNEKKAIKTGEEEPLKENDHAMDLIRYYILGRIGRPSRLAGWE